jgi:hypothetical protein
LSPQCPQESQKLASSASQILIRYAKCQKENKKGKYINDKYVRLLIKAKKLANVIHPARQDKG